MIKSTKRALIVSVMSLLLCATMFIGTTLAWFTDTDTVGVANIVAGNLDIEIVDANGDLKETALEFVNAPEYWQPGEICSTEEFAIKNNGSIDLKFKLEINNAEVSYNKLNEALIFTLVDEAGEAVVVDTMNDVILAAGASTGLYTIKCEFKADAGVEYMGLTLSGVGITVYATQLSDEAAYDDEIITVKNADEFIAAFASLEAGQTVTLTDNIDMTGKAWTPVMNKGFILNGNNHTITGLNGGLVDHTGSGEYTIKNVTFDGLTDDSATNYAGLIADADTCSYLNISNVTIKNASIKSAKYAAGFVAYTSGYGNDYDGPVNASHNFTNCTLVDSSVIGEGSTGALIGHAGGNTATTTTINGVNVNRNEIVGEDAEHTGVILGTAHVGEIVLNYNEASIQAGPAIGRFVPNGTGKLTVNGEEKTEFASEDKVPVVKVETIAPDQNAQENLNDVISNAASDGETVIVLPEGNYVLPSDSSMKNKDITISGSNATVVDYTGLQLGYAQDHVGTTLTFDGVTLNWQTGNQGYQGIKNPERVIFKNCIINGTQFMYSGADFINCTFTSTDYCVYLRANGDYTFTGCTFNTDGKAIMMYHDQGNQANVVLTDCKFYSNDTIKDKAAVETGDDSKTCVYNITFVNCTQEGFDINPNGINTNSELWGNKNSIPTDRLNVVINGVEVY